MFESLFKRLGLTSDDKKKIKNTDLKQGKAFINYEETVTEQTLMRLPLLELTSMPGLTSINEAFTSMDSVNSVNTYNPIATTEHENAFNQTLSEYSALQTNLESSALYHNVDKTSNKKIMNKLAELNAKLIYHAKKISEDMDKLQVDDESIKQYIKKKQATMNEYIKTLDKQRTNLTPASLTLDKFMPFSENKYNYLMWGIIFIIAMLMFMCIITSDFIRKTLFVIISVMVIYILGRIIMKK